MIREQITTRATVVLLAVLFGCIGGARLLGAAETLGAQPVYHVSLNGADINPGTLAHPFETLERARDAIQELKRQSSGLPGL